MFIAELFNGAPKHVPTPEQTYVEDSGPQLVILYPGRFQPFHLGHSDVFNALQSKFGRGNVYISTSNKTEEGRSPFNFSDKLVFMTAAGVPVDRVIENTSPYKLPPNFDPANTILVVAVGAPDADRLRPGSTKKDGQPGYYQKFESVDKCTTSDKHGYVLVAAERKKVVTIGGKQYDASHGTTVRNLWNAVRNKPQQRAEFITQMFGRNDPEVGRVLDKIDLGEAAGEVALPVDSASAIPGTIRESVEDDMFAPNKATQIYQVLRKAAEQHLRQYMELADQGGPDVDPDFVRNRIREVPSIVSLANAFRRRGLENGLIEWREMQNHDEDPHFSLSDWVSDVVAEEMPGTSLYKLYRTVCLQKTNEDSDDNMFAPSPGRKFQQALRGFAKSEQDKLDDMHPSWRDDSDFRYTQDNIAFVLDLADDCSTFHGFIRTLMTLDRVITSGIRNVWIYRFDDWMVDHGFARLAELFQLYDNQLNEDDMFADRSSTKLARQIAEEIAYLSNEMIEDPVGFIESRGWNEDGEVDLVDETMEAGAVFADLAERFKAGMQPGLSQLLHLHYQNTNNNVIEWIADETLEGISQDYDVDVSAYNLPGYQ